MSRAGEDDVRAIIQNDTTLRMAPFIVPASNLTDYVDSQDTDSVLTVKQLKDIETWLAAHFYAQRDQQYSDEITADGEATYQVGKAGLGCFELNDWGRTAMLLDVTGTLSRLNQQSKVGVQTASAVWLGKRPSEQTDYVDRD